MSESGIEPDTKLQPLSIEQMQVVHWIETYWNRKGVFPTVEQLRDRFGRHFNIKAQLRHPTFQLALNNRGIKIPTDNKFPDELTQEQIAAIVSIQDYTDTRSHQAKLRSLGLTTAQWQGWLKNRAFKEFLHQITTQNFEDAIHVAQEGLLKGLNRGDTNAIKYYMELTGRHTADSGSLQNIRVVVARIIESIQRHVKDPEVLRAISNDFEVIMSGGVPEVKVELRELI